ncbi:TIGR01777 family oxidoreductase [Leucobacter sp. GX24907]
MTNAAQQEHIVISGSSGLIGSALTESLQRDGFRVVRLVRRPAENLDEVEWLTDRVQRRNSALGQTASPELLHALTGAKAVVNLNGASIGKLPWTESYRKALRASRIEPTRTLATAIRELGTEAPLLVSGSAVGFYGDRPAETLTEDSSAGSTFLAELSREWEDAAKTAGPEARVALIRTAPLLHPESVLKPLILLTRFGVSGPLGTGRQIWPWISLDDEVRAIRHIIDRGITGPVNLTGPTPATANGIGRTLARQMRRPFLIPAPAWALRIGLGRDAADSLLLADARVLPAALENSGFEFRHPTAADAITAALS